MLLELGSSHTVCFAGCSPVIYAYSKGNGEITELLMESDSTVERFATADYRWASVMADALNKAMARKDLTGCQKLLDSGCHLNIAIKTPDGFATHLMTAIYEMMGHDMIEWLLRNGASVSPMIPKTTKMPFSTALEAAISQQRLNDLLDQMVAAYFDEGGSFLDHQLSPPHMAVVEQNLEGLRILLNALQGICRSQENPV
ncbi:hypothetical protein EDB81DRAFT_773866 [Dactylonectria macrodidyma]|uniref:Uncharacterized protein n=1 Tax=Dactylonectria macrodidyma TaxID=307937 RepID=A0A9P9FTC6_9HYPO|nr:hypothetical protein EDB81DRAFT_773866 [Dactylonectria macrodidyma]